MIADHLADCVGEQSQRSDVEARLLRDFCVDFALALDHHDAGKSRPIMAFSQPFDIVDRGVGSGFDTPVIPIDRFEPADRRILETTGFLLGGEDFYVVVQGALIALERDDVIGLFVDDFLGDASLTSHRGVSTGLIFD